MLIAGAVRTVLGATGVGHFRGFPAAPGHARAFTIFQSIAFRLSARARDDVRHCFLLDSFRYAALRRSTREMPGCTGVVKGWLDYRGVNRIDGAPATVVKTFGRGAPGSERRLEKSSRKEIEWGNEMKRARPGAASPMDEWNPVARATTSRACRC